MITRTDGKLCSATACKVYYCFDCKGDVFRIDNVAAIDARCEYCRECLTWIRDEDPEAIAARLGIPVSEWIDLR